MTGPEALRVSGVFLAVLVGTELLVRLAPLLRLLDAPDRGTTVGSAAPRKLQSGPVPAVGGIALLLGWLIAPAGLPGPTWVALLGVLFVGVVDDRRSLSPGWKALLQVAVLLPLLQSAGLGPGLLHIALLFTALNVANTFDNADGTLVSVAAVGCAFAPPFALAALLAFLPFNLVGVVPWGGRAWRARAYLGDGGAFFVGFTLTLFPAAAAALWIPALDLARVVLRRVQAGGSPFVGDRRHLAHRLAEVGMGSGQVAVWFALASFPGCLGVFLERKGTIGPPLLPLGIGLGAGLLLYLGLLRYASRVSLG